MLIDTFFCSFFFRSRYLLEEEGEIFRKGQALLGEAEMESEYAGEELRQGVRILKYMTSSFAVFD